MEPETQKTVVALCCAMPCCAAFSLLSLFPENHTIHTPIESVVCDTSDTHVLTLLSTRDPSSVAAPTPLLLALSMLGKEACTSLLAAAFVSATKQASTTGGRERGGEGGVDEPGWEAGGSS